METLQRTANRGSVSTGYDVEHSCKFEDDNNEWMYRDGPTAGNRRTFTLSMWVKYTGMFNLPAAAEVYLFDQGDDTAFKIGSGFFQYEFADGHVVRDVLTKLQDPNAWYHLMVAVDTTQGTAANRVKLYINGVQSETIDLDGGAYPAQNEEGKWMNTTDMFVGTNDSGSNSGDGDYDFSGYMSEVVVLDGTAAAPTDLGEFDEDSGIWKPIDASELTFGDEGFYLKFDDSSAMGTDSSGNSNTMTLNNISAADQAIDTCTNNFCTFNPLVLVHNNPVISDGGMRVTGGGGTFNQAFGSIGVSSGKWYFEVKVLDASDTGYFGLSTHPALPDSISSGQIMYNTSFIVGAASGIDYYHWSGGSQTTDENTGWGNLANGNVLGFAIDLDASTRTCKIFRNNSALSGNKANPFDLTANMQTGFLFPMYVQYEQNLDVWRFGAYTENTPDSVATDANGYGNFEYAPPSGFYAICTKNLAEYGG